MTEWSEAFAPSFATDSGAELSSGSDQFELRIDFSRRHVAAHRLEMALYCGNEAGHKPKLCSSRAFEKTQRRLRREQLLVLCVTQERGERRWLNADGIGAQLDSKSSSAVESGRARSLS